MLFQLYRVNWKWIREEILVRVLQDRTVVQYISGLLPTASKSVLGGVSSFPGLLPDLWRPARRGEPLNPSVIRPLLRSQGKSPVGFGTRPKFW